MPTRAGFVFLRKLWAAYQEIPIRNPWQSEECGQPFSSACQRIKAELLQNLRLCGFNPITQAESFYNLLNLHFLTVSAVNAQTY